MRTYYYQTTTDDVVHSANQKYNLSDNYSIFPTSFAGRLWNKIARRLAHLFGLLYAKLILHVEIIGKEKISSLTGGFFVYGNHTQPVGDVFIPFTIFPNKNLYAIAEQANWGIPFIGKFLVRYGGLPVGKNIKQAGKLVKAIQTIICDKKGIVLIYPEAHVWPYYPKIRPFDETSMHFPVSLDAPSFTLTTTYQKRKKGKRPKITLYLDGPFYPDKTLSRKQAQAKLHNKIWNSFNSHAKLSNYSYYKYQRIKRGED